MTEQREPLSLGRPERQARPRGDPRPPRRVQRPSPVQQGQRLTPQFSALQAAFGDRRAELAETTAAPDPQLVAVLDLAGSVEGFVRASRGIKLEFLAEFQEEYAPPDENFFYEDGGEVSDDGVPESLYVVMTNARAVTELVRLFELWQEDPSTTFEWGLNPLKQVFGLLRAVRLWGPEDRVRETGLIEQWNDDVRVVGSQGFARVEVELWFREHSGDRAKAQQDATAAIESAGGNVITAATLPEVAYHGVLADVPYSAVRDVLRDGPAAIALLTTDSIMLVRPSLPMSFPLHEPTDEGVDTEDWPAPPAGPPRVALLDGVPLANHPALAGRLVLDDPDDRQSGYPSAQRGHGTAMASLILHGDLSAPGPPLGTQLYVRPVLEPHEHFDTKEIAPRDELLVDLLHRAFRRMFEGDGEHPPVAQSVRIVNLSIGDPARVFTNRMSPLAKLLDWVTHNYNVLVLVSAGNHPAVRPIVGSDVLASPDTVTAQALRSIHDSTRQRRLLAPAEAINVLTVGALNRDAAPLGELPDTVLDVLPEGAPAPYSAVGFGYRRSVKPEILLPGGRTLYVRPPPDAPAAIELSQAPTAAAGPGLRVAAPGPAGALNGTAFGHGTSHATALATRAANEIIEILEELTESTDGFPFPGPEYHPVLAKTLLVHAAGWGDLRNTLPEMLGLSGTQRRRQLTQMLGYGPVSLDRLGTAARVRPLLIGAGSIRHDDRHTFRMPLPDALRATVDWRRLTVTLGWFSPINARSQRHRVARLRVDAHDHTSTLGVAAVEADHNAIYKGTVQHQTLEGTSAAAFVKGDELHLSIDCHADAGPFNSAIRYGLAVSLEVAATSQIDLEAQMRALIVTRSRAQTRARTADLRVEP